VRIAGFSQAPVWDMVAALPDGRTVIPVVVYGRTRLMVVQRGKDPVSLVNTTEETAAPMTAVGANQIAFSIGPEPHETIALADTATGRISGRISPGKGVIKSLAASPDGATLYFTAGGSVWSVASTGGASRQICSGERVVAYPSGHRLVVARQETSKSRLFEVPAGGGAERAIPSDPASPLFWELISSVTIRGDGQMLVSLYTADSAFNPLGLLDLQSGKIRRIAGDRASDLHSAVWTRDGQIVASRVGFLSMIWKFTPESK